MTSTDPSTWTAGTVVLHRSGKTHTLRRRDTPDQGWWLTDGGGLSDRAVADGDWIALTPEVVAHLFTQAGAG